MVPLQRCSRRTDPVDVMRTLAKSDFKLERKIISDFSDGTWSAYRLTFSKVSLVVDGASDANDEKELQRDEDRSSSCVRKATGQVDDVRFPPSWSVYRINMAQRILGAIQLSNPKKGQTEWTATERASGGDWLVKYALKRKSQSIRKTWIRHLHEGRWDSGEALVGDQRIRSGHLDISLAHGRVLSIKGQHTTTHGNEVRELTKTRLAFSMKREVSNSKTVGLGGTLKYLTKKALSWPPNHVWMKHASIHQRKKQAEALYSSKRMAEILSLLGKVDTVFSQVDQRLHRFVEELSNLSLIKPELITQLTQLLKNKSRRHPSHFY